MSKFQVTMNSISGEYEANSRDEALDLFAKDAGYKSWDDACEQGLASDDEVSVEEVNAA